MKEKFDVVIIGGGAAGLFCAIEAGKRGRRVLVIERNGQLGRKILISGGGRCNFTNIHTSAENFVSQNPHFCKSALARYTPEDFVRLVRLHGIQYYEKKLGQLFCRESSRQIVDMLARECERYRVTLRAGCSVKQIDPGEAFHLSTTAGDLTCESVVIATGGLSFPKIGATDFGYSIASQFGLKLEPTRPSLVALVFENGRSSASLAGISVDSTVATNGISFRENILHTHRGLSGPAILQISNYWKQSEPVSIDLLPGLEALELLTTNRTSAKTLANFLATILPERLAESLFPPQLAATPINKLNETELRRIARDLNSREVRFGRTEGYDKAEVTLGGVSTAELSSTTMEARKVPGLFFIGEIVDVTGWLGGYNFQWAWASAYAAGQVV